MHPGSVGVLETGTGVDSSGAALAGKKVACAGRPDLATASGSFQQDSAADVSIDELNETAVALHRPPDAPNALAMGRRCAELGYEFWWPPMMRCPSPDSPMAVSYREHESIISGPITCQAGTLGTQ